MQALLHRIRQIVARVPGIDLGLRANRRAMLNEQFYRLGMRLLGGPHQSRSRTQLVFCIHVGMMIQQHPHRIQLPVRAASISGVSPSGPSAFGSAPAFNTFSIIGALPSQRRQIQRCSAFAICQLNVGAGRYQHVRHLQIVAIHGPLDRRRSVGLRSVHVGFLLQRALALPTRSPLMAASAKGLLVAAKAPDTKPALRHKLGRLYAPAYRALSTPNLADGRCCRRWYLRERRTDRERSPTDCQWERSSTGMPDGDSP